jgi:type II secretion system protein D
MTQIRSKWAAITCAVAFIFATTSHLHAQRTGGINRGAGGGNFGGGGGGFGGNRAAGATSGAGTRQYYNNGMVGEAMISSDPETRRLIVITDDETSQFVSQVVTNLDRPKPQVLIKVVFLEVTYGKSYDLGIEGGARKNINNHTAVGLTNLFGLAAQGAGGTPGAGLYQIAGNNFEVTLRAIAQADKTEVLSRPSILARNNQQAIITVGQEIPLITNTRFDTFGNQINTVQYQDVGIILRVTPFITSDGLVEMIVSPEISNLSAKTIPISTGANPVFAPIIDKRSADTVVVTPDGQPVVIGGLMEDTKTQTDAKIPVLGDIPLLGNLFKRKARGNTKTELLIFLTPHIVMQPSQVAALSASERQNMQILQKSFSEDELNRFLDGVGSKNNNSSPARPSDNNGVKSGRGQQ